MWVIEACICWIASTSILLRQLREPNSQPARRRLPASGDARQLILPTSARSSPVSLCRTSRFPGPQQFLDRVFQLQRRQCETGASLARTCALVGRLHVCKGMDDKSAPAGIGAAGCWIRGTHGRPNPSLDYGPSDFSVKHRFVNSAVYSSARRTRKTLPRRMNRAGDLAIGGGN